MKRKLLLLFISVVVYHFVFGYATANEASFPSISDHLISKRNVLETFRGFPHQFPDDTDTSKLTISRRIYNSSIALTIPFYSFKIPHLIPGSFIANQAIFGLFSWGITALTFGFSFLFTGDVPTDSESRRFKSLSRAAKDSSFNFLGSDFSKSFGMDGMQCIQKVICQAHRFPENKKYGVISTTIQTLFPAPENASQTTSPIKSAAKAGKYMKNDCENLYDCILDPLGSARYLAYWYSHNHHNARILLRILDFHSPLDKI